MMFAHSLNGFSKSKNLPGIEKNQENKKKINVENSAATVTTFICWNDRNYLYTSEVIWLTTVAWIFMKTNWSSRELQQKMFEWHNGFESIWVRWNTVSYDYKCSVLLLDINSIKASSSLWFTRTLKTSKLIAKESKLKLLKLQEMKFTLQSINVMTAFQAYTKNFSNTSLPGLKTVQIVNW